MKKIIFTIALLTSLSFLNAQNSEIKDTPLILLDSDELQKGNERLNIFLYKTLGEMKISLKKQKKKLNELDEKETYYSKVKKEKETLKILNEIKKSESCINEIRNKISSKKYTKAYSFQKAPESVVNHFFNAFINNDFSKFDYLIDPYGEYSDDMKYFNLFSIIKTYFKEKNLFSNFEKEVNYEIINTRIENGKAFVLVKLNKKETSTYRRYGESSNHERLFSLINRKGNWYLMDINK